MAGRPRSRRLFHGKELPGDLRRLILRRVAKGVHPLEIADEVGVHRNTVDNVVRPLGGVIRPEEWQESDSRLSLDDRVEIRIALEKGCSYREIGELIGRNKSTVCREVNANGGRTAYRPMSAHKRAMQLAKREKPTKLARNEQLCDVVTEWLTRGWSPEQISQRLVYEFGDDPSMRVSHETIYKSLYVQGRGELSRELTRFLRTQRKRRIPQGRQERRGRIPDMVMIRERPPEVEDRAVPGDWEGDLILGKNGKSAIGTLVERCTRFVILLPLPEGRTADAVREAMTQRIQTLPEALRRSITWDQGREMAQHAKFTIDTGIPVYFCDPHSPWQRGTNENTNGLLRQYLPKGTDLTIHDTAALDRIADLLNGRPRKTLNWKTPAEELNTRLVATTD